MEWYQLNSNQATPASSEFFQKCKSREWIVGVADLSWAGSRAVYSIAQLCRSYVREYVLIGMDDLSSPRVLLRLYIGDSLPIYVVGCTRLTSEYGLASLVAVELFKLCANPKHIYTVAALKRLPVPNLQAENVHKFLLSTAPSNINIEHEDFLAAWLLCTSLMHDVPSEVILCRGYPYSLSLSDMSSIECVHTLIESLKLSLPLIPWSAYSDSLIQNLWLSCVKSSDHEYHCAVSSFPSKQIEKVQELIDEHDMYI